MTSRERWGLTGAVLLLGAVTIFCVSAITGIWNGWAVLGVLMVGGFVGITQATKS
jgi:hypothetical protein